MKTSLVKSAILMLFAITSTASAAIPKPNVYDGGNKWRITFYDDSSAQHNQWATQEICFLPYATVGTSVQGRWYSTSFPDWNGQWYQEGDELKMTGDYANNVGHDHMTLIHTTYDSQSGIAFKDWTEWREDESYGRIVGWGNARLVRVGKCKVTKGINAELSSERLRVEKKALSISSSLPERLTVKGEIARFPGQRDMESLDDYLKRYDVQ